MLVRSDAQGRGASGVEGGNCSRPVQSLRRSFWLPFPRVEPRLVARAGNGEHSGICFSPVAVLNPPLSGSIPAPRAAAVAGDRAKRLNLKARLAQQYDLSLFGYGGGVSVRECVRAGVCAVVS